MDKLTEEIVNVQVDIKLGLLAEEKLNEVLKKINSRKVEDLDEIALEVSKIWQHTSLIIKCCL